MPPFFNRLTSLAPDEQYPYDVPTYPRPMYPGARGIFGRGPYEQPPNLTTPEPDISPFDFDEQPNEPDLDTEVEQSVAKKLNPYAKEFEDLSQKLKTVADKTPGMDAYQQFLSGSVPDPNDYRPGKLDRLTAALAGFSAGGQEGPTKGVLLARDILQQPYERATALYNQRAKQLEQGALAEEKKLYNTRLSYHESLRDLLSERDIARKEAADEAREKSRQRANEIRQQLVNDRNLKLWEEPGRTLKIVNIKTGEVKDTKLTSRHLSDQELQDLRSKHSLELVAARGTEERKAIEARAKAWSDTQGWHDVNIPDPNDENKTIAARINRVSGEVKFYNKDGNTFGPLMGLGKPQVGPNGQITAQTRAMMEGAKMLIEQKHTTKLRQEALDLYKINLFGPIASRVRTLASNIGWAGDPDTVANELIKLGDQIRTMPTEALSGGDTGADFKIGRFVSDLGLMTSAMGRVHGGARGGGSIEMVKYLKALFSSNVSVDMFLSYLTTIDDYLEGYAKGPYPIKTPTENLYDRVNKKLGLVP